MSQFDLKDRVSLITGSSRGIGRAIAEELASLGAKVVISSRKQDACDLVAQAINERHGAGTAVAIAASISDKQALQGLVKQSENLLGPIDILVCNAASNPYHGPMSVISDEQFLKILVNNVVANNWLIQVVAPGMIARHAGSVIVISSIGGLVGSNTIGAYNISKAAGLQLVRNLAVEFGPHNVRVNGIAPGVIRTDFARAIWQDPLAEAALSLAAQQLSGSGIRVNAVCPGLIETGMTQLLFDHARAKGKGAQLGQLNPLRRAGNAEEIAAVIAFLASEDASYVNGHAIAADGGLSSSVPFARPPRLGEISF